MHVNNNTKTAQILVIWFYRYKNNINVLIDVINKWHWY